MDDDIDDLLDEFESKFSRTPHDAKKCKSGIKETNSQSSKSTSRKDVSANPNCRKKMTDDIDDLLNDIDSVTVSPSSHISLPADSKTSSSITTTSGSARCFPVYLGGTDVSIGSASSVNKCACDQLRCTACDFRIVMYDHYQWDKTTDYLFLRNNVPDFHKLKAKLKKKKGCRAYACQCSWRSVESLVDLHTDRGLKWVCAGGH